MSTNRFLVIAGSTRPIRRSPVIAEWVATLGRQAIDAPFRTVDLRDLGLGLDDEPGIPAKGVYEREATQRWSAQIEAARGVVFVTPQYNWGYPAALKNAVDHLYREWKGKPALIVSYGGHGGGKCAAQLRQVLEGLDMQLVDAMPALRLTRERIEADDGHVEPEHDFADHQDAVIEALTDLVTLSKAGA